MGEAVERVGALIVLEAITDALRHSQPRPIAQNGGVKVTRCAGGAPPLPAEVMTAVTSIPGGRWSRGPNAARHTPVGELRRWETRVTQCGRG